jgi:CYTH domain-containing protein
MPSGVEIERKFLVERIPSNVDAYPCKAIDQGYLVAQDALEVRIRKYGDRSFLTIKSGGGSVRLEEEIEIDDRRFTSLWRLTEGRQIRKRRYLIPLDDTRHTIELDVYEDELSGLVVAEVEFDSPEAATAFAPPDWLGDDVSDDPRYKNRRLAVEGRPG